MFKESSHNVKKTKRKQMSGAFKYIKENLLPEESIMIYGSLSKMILVDGFIGLFIRLVLLAVVPYMFGDGYWIVFSIIAVFVVLKLYSVVMSILNFLGFEFAVTNKRMIRKRGFISRDVVDILVQNIVDISISQGILGRMFNFGSARITYLVGVSENRFTIDYIVDGSV